MRWQKGQSGNPDGRPAKERAVAELLRTQLKQKIDGVEVQKTVAERVVTALHTGILEFPAAGKSKKGRRIKLAAKQWIDLFKYVTTHVDGPAKIDVNLSGPVPGTVASDQSFDLPAGCIAPDFIDPWLDIKDQSHTEYVFKGGRGSTKSSFVSLVFIYLLKKYPDVHGLAVRQFSNTLRDSVFSQLQWAIGELGLEAEFKCTTSPLEIEYLPTGQKIYFRGADDPNKIKSIKPTFGYIALLWFEELDQFRGPEAVRKIEQSAIRGGDIAFIFKSFNPPRSANNWVNKYILVPKENRYVHTSSYLTVPRAWLGKTFIDEAEHLKKVNPKAYDHEYLGLVNGTGGQVFENVEVREITDDEIFGKDDGSGFREGGFDHILEGLDWGFFPDPASYGKMHFDAARHTLYIFGEVRKWKTSNRDLFDALVEYGYNPANLLIADSAEPKSVGDFRAYGANIRGAEKGEGSVKYSMKWLQSLVKIVIDPVRAPYHAEEFVGYEYEMTKEGEFISEFPDKNNHAIDDTRYGTNLIWRRRGE